MITIRVVGANAVDERLAKVAPDLRAALVETMERAVTRVVAHVRRTKFGPGKVIDTRPGARLWQSLQTAVTVEGDEVRGVVRVGGRVRRWAGIHEYGGRVRVRSHARRTGAVAAYGYAARRRAFLAPSLAETEQANAEDFRQAVAKVIEEA